MPNNFSCAICGLTVDSLHDRYFRICHACAEGRVQCEDCGNYEEAGNITNNVCNDCRAECDSCGNLHSISQMLICETRRCERYVCQTCVIRCYSCETVLCNSCSYACGGGCERNMCQRHAEYCDCGNYICTGCSRAHECPARMPRVVRPYNYRPEHLVFSPRRPDTYGHLGVELEYEAGNHVRIHNAVNGIREIDSERIYFKEDGSLRFGFEIVSMPMSWDYHYRNFNWSGVMDVVVNAELTAELSCGMHVHVSRRGFGEDEENRLMQIMHKFEDSLIALSGRERDRLDRWAQWNTRGFRRMDYDALAEAKSNFSRYRAINFCNRNTLEFRFFAGTADFEEFMARMDVVDTMSRIATYRAEMPENWEDFMNTLTRSESVERINQRMEVR